jgi:hypothetical protein
MAKRIENECAYCAEYVDLEKRIIGEDWKVYCSRKCADAGESSSRDEMARLILIAQANRVRPNPPRTL